MVTVTIDERDLMSLVVCAVNAAEVESAFETDDIARMPAPFPQMLARVQSIYDHWMTLEDPYEVYPEGWQAAALAAS